MDDARSMQALGESAPDDPERPLPRGRSPVVHNSFGAVDEILNMT